MRSADSSLAVVHDDGPLDDDGMARELTGCQGRLGLPALLGGENLRVLGLGGVLAAADGNKIDHGHGLLPYGLRPLFAALRLYLSNIHPKP